MEFGIEWVGRIGTVVEAIAISTGEHEFFRCERSEFFLQSCWTQFRHSGEVAQMVFLISLREKQSENFRFCLRKEIGE